MRKRRAWNHQYQSKLNEFSKAAFFLFLFCADISLAQISVREWPEWFIYPFRYPGVITGYSYNGCSTKIDAANNYFLFKNCKVTGKLNLYTASFEKDMGRQSEYFYDFAADTSSGFLNSLKSVDRYIINVLTGDYIEAFIRDSSRRPAKYPRLKEPVSVPGWISTSFCYDSVYYYGTGVYTSMGNDIDAWKSAEEKAIFSVIKSTSIELFRVLIIENTDSEDEESEEVSVYKLNCLLSNIEILERYPDTKNKLFYVYVRVRQTDLKQINNRSEDDDAKDDDTIAPVVEK